jgi:hypothetical protein
MIAYETQREYFNKILKMYLDYVKLYKFFNHGSIRGKTKFEDFYWLHTYYYRNASIEAKSNRAV